MTLKIYIILSAKIKQFKKQYNFTKIHLEYVDFKNSYTARSFFFTQPDFTVTVTLVFMMLFM